MARCCLSGDYGTVAAEGVLGGVWDIFKSPMSAQSIAHLGYPRYVLIIIGVWKLLGAVAVLVPRLPRLKEWAYAGMFFNYTGVIASHLAVGDTSHLWPTRSS